MCAARQIGVVANWRYLIRERDGDGLFAVVRRDTARDILEDEIAFCWSEQVAELIAESLVACERRKLWQNTEIPRT